MQDVSVLPVSGPSQSSARRRVRSSDPARRDQMDRPSPAVQDYLKAIYQLGESAEREGPVTTSQVSESLSVTTASASNMLKKLDGMGYVVQMKRQGVDLTDSGRGAALEGIRRHRLLETFLATRLGMSWDEVHREAE